MIDLDRPCYSTQIVESWDEDENTLFNPKKHIREVRELVRNPGMAANENRAIIISSNAYLSDKESARKEQYKLLNSAHAVRGGFSHIGAFEDDDCVDSSVENRFVGLAARWKNESRFISSVTKKCMLPSYQQIINMGATVVPLILNDLEVHGPNDWFWALTKITGENPITHEIAGNMSAMTEAWLQWGTLKDCQQSSLQKMKLSFDNS